MKKEIRVAENSRVTINGNLRLCTVCNRGVVMRVVDGKTVAEPPPGGLTVTMDPDGQTCWITPHSATCDRDRDGRN